MTDTGNLGTGGYARTIEGDGFYERTSTGDGATQPSDTGAIDYLFAQSADPHSGTFDASWTGTTRYDLLEDFHDISNTQPGRSPGHMNFYPFGQPFVDPFWEYVGAGLGGAWDGVKMLTNAGLNVVTLGNSPLNDHVDNLIQQNGGGYAFANGAANVAAVAIPSAAALRAARAARAAAAAGTVARTPQAWIAAQRAAGWTNAQMLQYARSSCEVSRGLGRPTWFWTEVMRLLGH